MIGGDDDNCTAFPPSLSLPPPSKNKHKSIHPHDIHADGPDGPSRSTTINNNNSGLLPLPLPLATDPRALRAALPRLREAWHLLFQELTLDTLRWGGGGMVLCRVSVLC